MNRKISPGRHIFLSCGEASGTRYGAAVIAALRAADPTLRFSALGGASLAAAGAEVVQDAEGISVMGWAEALAVLPAVLKARRRVWRHLASQKIDLVLPVDFPGFNLRVAGHAHRLGIPVFYLIPPQLWAWGQWRLGALRRNVDRVGTILPFEEEYFQRQGLSVVPLGHPLMEDYADYPFEQGLEEREKTFADPDASLTVGILPGSRPQEVRQLMPVLKVAAQMLQAHLTPRPVRFVVSSAPGIRNTGLLGLVAAGFEVSEEPLPQLLPRLHLAFVCSGTASLEAALAGVPHDLVYRVSPLSYHIARRLIRVRRVGLANLILGRDLVREHLQSDASPVPLARALLQWVAVAQSRQAFYNETRRLRSLCGEPGVWRRASEAILDFLARRQSVG